MTLTRSQRVNQIRMELIQKGADPADALETAKVIEASEKHE